MTPDTGLEKEITIRVRLDASRVPESISWDATDRDEEAPSSCDALVLGLWNRDTKSAFRIDLWTNRLPVDEMGAFLARILVSLGDTCERATGRPDLSDALREFGREFARRAAGGPSREA